MQQENFFPPRPAASPKIYAYSIDDPNHKGLLKVGYTTRDVRQRVNEQLRTARITANIEIEENAVRNDGTTFCDRDVHRLLSKYQCSGEWFRCTKSDVISAIAAVRERRITLNQRTENFSMRPEQRRAVEETRAYFHSWKSENPGKPPRFLWNAKMRFGKTFSTYQLAKVEGYQRILVLTFKPAAEESWRDDLEQHKDFEGWQFITRGTELTYETADHKRPIVYFGSFQDFLGRDNAGNIKPQNRWVHTINWDLVVFDEYHFGAWRDNARELFEAEDSDEQRAELNNIASDIERELAETGNTDFLPITTDAYLFLSGTPFRAIASGEFIEEQIFNWTYSDEQRAKQEWRGQGTNPYEPLPRMVLMTYQMPDSINEIASRGEFDEFDLNEFFAASGSNDAARFKHTDEVQKWLDLIRGGYLETTIDELKLGAKKPPLPYSDSRLKNILSHTFWFLPSVASCYAMRNLLAEHQNAFYHDYTINVAAGPEAGIGHEALAPVIRSLKDPLQTKTITLSCGKLTTGVTVKPWTGVFMLRNLKSPETYFQAAFRAQSPWVIHNPDGQDPRRAEIMKRECYIFDFAPTRALHQIVDYSCQLNPDKQASPEQSVNDIINFLPVLAYDGSSMREIDAAEILDVVTAGTSATLLAKRWESALLVNVDNITLKRLMDNKHAMDALMKIEGFRSLNEDIETILNKSEQIQERRQELGDLITQSEKKELSKEETEYKSLRKQVQGKLIKFATRIPIFMYLTDKREYTLRDVITKLEPGLFKKVTGLSKDDFELLLSLNVFNSTRMNDAVYKFKRYEDASLSYTGIDKHKQDASVGLFDTTVTKQEFEEM